MTYPKNATLTEFELQHLDIYSRPRAAIYDGPRELLYQTPAWWYAVMFGPALFPGALLALAGIQLIFEPSETRRRRLIHDLVAVSKGYRTKRARLLSKIRSARNGSR